ncbi:hypothetical protein [Amycolatopsis sp. lyj-346]|uniref:hypothetical protein n=1 Tax=Amycolatopsis sp. lyj-346 TaxID=2789289 RepID=UPI00397D1CDB
MNTVEVAANKQIAADGGVLSALHLADRLFPVGCFAAEHAALTVALAGVKAARAATDRAAEANFANQAHNVLGIVAAAAHGGKYVDEQPVSLRLHGGNLSATALATLRVGC